MASELSSRRHNVWSVMLSPLLVIVSSNWGMITAYDRETGKLAFTID